MQAVGQEDGMKGGQEGEEAAAEGEAAAAVRATAEAEMAFALQARYLVIPPSRGGGGDGLRPGGTLPSYPP